MPRIHARMTPEPSISNNDTGNFDTAIQDWSKFFQLFQDRGDLRPHHNVEVKGLLSQEDMQSNGELIYYYRRDIGSFRLTYDYERYLDGELAQGTIEPRDEIKNLHPNNALLSDYYLNQEIGVFSEKTYLEPDMDREENETSLRCLMEIPTNYDSEKAASTIKAGEIFLSHMMDKVCEYRRNPNSPDSL